jgi:hypothetical protein
MRNCLKTARSTTAIAGGLLMPCVGRIAPLRLLLGLCVFAAGCGGEMTRSPTSPSNTFDRAAQTPADAAPAERVTAMSAQSHPQTGVPFRGSYDQTETGVLQSPTTVLITESAVGTATHLGRYTMTSRALIDLTTGIGTALGNAVFVAANGDRLFTTGSGQATPTGVPNELSIQGTATIVGGTGRFEGATGSFSGVRLLNTATGISSGSFDGTINLVH